MNETCQPYFIIETVGMHDTGMGNLAIASAFTEMKCETKEQTPEH